MRQALLLAFAVLGLFAGSLSGAGAIGKTNIDPNAGMQPKNGALVAVDTRLDQKITYAAERKALKYIMEDLTRMTGVRLKAGYNNSDWQVRDRKMNIFVTDLALSELMDSIARVMKFQWSKNSDVVPPTYRIFADRRAIAELMAEQQRNEAVLKQEIYNRRVRMVEEFQKVAELSGSEATRLKEENPYLYVSWKSGFARILMAFFEELPFTKQAFLNSERNYAIPMADLSPSTRELYNETVRSAWDYRQVGRKDKKPLPDNINEAFDDGYIAFETVPWPFNESSRRVLYDFGHIELIGRFRDVDGELSKAYSLEAIAEVDGKTSSDELAVLVEKSRAIRENSDDENDKYLLIDPELDHENDEGLDEKYRLDIDIKEPESEWAVGGVTLTAVQKAIAHNSGLNIISDSFSALRGKFDADTTEISVKDALQALAKGFRYNWEKHGNVIDSAGVTGSESEPASCRTSG